MAVSVLVKIKLGQAQISVPKIYMPMLKASCINPWWLIFEKFSKKKHSKYILDEI